MHIEVSPQIEQFIQSQVSAGIFADPQQLVTVAVEKMMDERDPDMPGWTKEALRAAVALGADQADRGEVSPYSMEEIIANWEKKHSTCHTALVAGSGY
jgi:Arc/MetJ-type ribon-helix-helix transcriptional regulator